MLKVRYLSQSVIPSQSANSIHVVKMCEAFAKNGHDVKLVCRRSDDSFVGSVYEFYGVAGNFDLEYFNWPKIPFGGAFLYALKVGKRLAKNKQHTDLIYSRCPYSTLIARVIGLPYIYEAHALPRTIFHRYLEVLILKSKYSSSFVVITEALKKDYIDTFPFLSKQKIVVAPDGATLTPLVDKKNSIDERNRLKILYTGSFLPGKGVDLIIALAQRLPEHDFHLVGGTSEIWQLYSDDYDIPENVLYHGFLSPSDVGQWQRDADILLLPNQRQVLTDKGRVDIGKWTSPLKLFEYMSSGNPIIASDILVLREVLTHQQNALLVSPDSIDEWVAAIQSLAREPGLRQKLGMQARKEVECLYTWQERARRVLLQKAPIV